MRKQSWDTSSRLSWWGAIAGITVGLLSGVLTGLQPLVLVGLIITGVTLFCFVACFEQTVLGLLILRSSLDILSDYQIPAAFAVGLDCLTLMYIAMLLVTHQQIRTDWFWWFFAIWVTFQGLWVILLPLGSLGLDSSVLIDSIREWIRLFSWVMIYLLVMQLEGKIAPAKIVKLLFLALIMPLILALMQLGIPSLLPEILSPTAGLSANVGLEVSRVRGTLGHSNTFATILLLFIGLTMWQIRETSISNRWLWLLLLSILAFFFVSTKALFGLMMLGTFVLVWLVPKLNLVNLIAGLVLLAFIVIIFASSEFGQERLASLTGTPLLNSDIEVWKAILLSKGDQNSFNWRLAQWTYLLKQWQQFPWLGYGLGTSQYVSNNQLYPHNDYIRALVEGGIVGLVSFVSFFVVQAIRLWQLLKTNNSQQHELCFVMIAFFFALPVGMITENIWSHTTLFFYWWTLMAIAGWNWQELKQRDKSKSNWLDRYNYDAK
jgi:O-antigen ligase